MTSTAASIRSSPQSPASSPKPPRTQDQDEGSQYVCPKDSRVQDWLELVRKHAVSGKYPDHGFHGTQRSHQSRIQLENKDIEESLPGSFCDSARPQSPAPMQSPFPQRDGEASLSLSQEIEQPELDAVQSSQDPLRAHNASQDNPLNGSFSPIVYERRKRRKTRKERYEKRREEPEVSGKVTRRTKVRRIPRKEDESKRKKSVARGVMNNFASDLLTTRDRITLKPDLSPSPSKSGRRLAAKPDRDLAYNTMEFVHDPERQEMLALRGALARELGDFGDDLALFEDEPGIEQYCRQYAQQAQPATPSSRTNNLTSPRGDHLRGAFPEIVQPKDSFSKMDDTNAKTQAPTSHRPPDPIAGHIESFEDTRPRFGVVVSQSPGDNRKSSRTPTRPEVGIVVKLVQSTDPNYASPRAEALSREKSVLRAYDSVQVRIEPNARQSERPKMCTSSILSILNRGLGQPDVNDFRTPENRQAEWAQDHSQRSFSPPLRPSTTSQCNHVARKDDSVAHNVSHIDHGSKSIVDGGCARISTHRESLQDFLNRVESRYSGWQRAI